MAQAQRTADGTIIEPDSDQLETWKNATKGRIVVQKLGALGQRRAEMIGPGRVIHITPQERRMNQELAANKDLDDFLNGRLQPIKLDQSVEDFAELTSNPNLLGDDAQVARLFTASDDVFAERLSEIKNPASLERLLELANDDATGARVSQLKMIEARLAQVTPRVDSVHATGGDDRESIRKVELR